MRNKMTKETLIAFESQVKKMFEDGEIKVPIHLCGSTDGAYEDKLIELFDSIKDKDYVFSNHRNHYHYLLKTGDEHGLLEELLGSSSGVCYSNSGSMHTISREHNFFSSGIVAGCVAIAVGVATGLKRQGSDAKVYCFVGDGATDSGWFVEAVRYGISHKLPITFIIEDNDRSVCTSKEARWGNEDDITTTHDQAIIIKYESKYPHAGIGKFIEF